MALTSASVQFNFNTVFGTRYGNIQPFLVPMLTGVGIGTGSGNANLLYVGSRTATTAGDLIDLNGGGLLQVDQTPFNAVATALIYIVNQSGTETLTVGGGTNAIANVSGTIPPSGVMVLFAPAGYPVTAGSADTIKVVSTAATSAYDVMILGRTA